MFEICDVDENHKMKTIRRLFWFGQVIVQVLQQPNPCNWTQTTGTWNVTFQSGKEPELLQEAEKCANCSIFQQNEF